uniref:Uncharacterized protein n=1 Tax=Arundo donax TaxID=35708 RepID=A0A0A9CKN8_ARUDO
MLTFLGKFDLTKSKYYQCLFIVHIDACLASHFNSYIILMHPQTQSPVIFLTKSDRVRSWFPALLRKINN